MTDLTFPGSPPVTVTLRRSKRARRYSLRVSRLRGSVTLTLPTRAPEADAIAFAREKLEWIRGHLAERPVTVLADAGAEIPVEGVSREIRRVPGLRRITLKDDALLVPERLDRPPQRIGAFLKEHARMRLRTASDHFAGILGRPYAALTIRDTRSRWGSCSSEGKLMYSWRLILAPPEVLNYVAAHEVAHLAQMNHSAAFWAEVERLMPDYATHRAWLRKNGETLHGYQFSD